MDDKSIIQLIREEGISSQQKEGWRQMYLKYKDSLAGNLRRTFPGYEAINKDIVNDTILIVWSNIVSGRYKDEGKLSGYINAVGRITCMRYHKKRGSQLSLSSIPELDLGEEAGAEAAVQEAEKARNLSIRQLRDCYNQLNDEEKKIMEAKYVDNLSFKKIAEMRGMSPVALRQKVFRIRTKLKKYLNQKRR